LRRALHPDGGEPFDCASEFLDEVRFPQGAEERMRDLLAAKYGGTRFAAVVAVAPASLQFCLAHRSQLFPDLPLLFAEPGGEAGPTGSPSGVAGVQASPAGPATVRLAYMLHPRTEQILLVGAPGSDSLAPAAAEAAAREAGFRGPIHRLASAPLPRLLEELAAIPEKSLVVDLGDHTADPVPATESAERLARASRAPAYTALEPFVGSGFVGGVATPVDAIARRTAALVAEVLAHPDSMRETLTLAATPVFDWRELKRLRIRTSQLPPGSIVRFRPPSFWRQHLALVVTTGGLILLQSVLIIALVLQSRRRHRAEREARRGREEMAQRLLAAGTADPQELVEILADIASDDQRAGEVIHRMRALLRKGEPKPAAVNVNDLVSEVVGLVRGELILQNVSLALDLAPGLPPAHGDRVQLQQVLLNLIVNALDAMKETPESGRRILVRTEAADRRTVRVSVQDSGGGVPAQERDRIFEPFVSTKPQGMGLGLAICRSIIQSHGGLIGTLDGGGRGATFWFTLPAEEVKR
jgi:signal transduction histidine kinase